MFGNILINSMSENKLAAWRYRLQLQVWIFQQFNCSLHGFATKVQVLSGAVLAFFLRRFIFVSRVIMILPDVHISTASSEFPHVISSCENKSSAIFKTKLIGHPPRMTREIPREAEISIGNQSVTFGVCWVINFLVIFFGNSKSFIEFSDKFTSSSVKNKGNYAFLWAQKS